MKDAVCPALELLCVVPGLLLAYLPVKSYLKQPPRRLLVWLLPLLAGLCVGGGWACRRLDISVEAAGAVVALVAVILYVATLCVSLWKSGTIALSVLAAFACLGGLTRASEIYFILPHGEGACLRGSACYHLLCWLLLAVSCYPASHMVRAMVEDDHFPQTWYVFWILPILFIALNLFMLPRRPDALRTGRMAQGYFVISLALLLLLVWFYAVFLLMANSLNRNARLQQENHLLSMQRERYESLCAAIEEARQARHDMRHQLNRLSALAEEGNLENIREYLRAAVGRLPSLDMKFCENRAADSVIGYYCALARREGIPFQAQADLPERLPGDEIDLCLALSNLLENALEASLRTAPSRRRIQLRAYTHAQRLLLLEVENAFDGEIQEKDGVFQSSKRRGSGVGIQSVRRIAEKNGGACSFLYQDGVFTAGVMLRG